MKMIQRLLLFLLFCGFLPASASAQSPPLAGDWLGTLKIQTMSLRMVFHVSRGSDGVWSATLDSPDQGATGLAVDGVSAEGANVRLSSSLLRGEYVGVMQPGDSVIEGSWSQGGRTFPLPLRRLHAAVTVNRPQVPTAPFPYSETEVTFTNRADDVTLAGTLTLPAGEGPFPAVALISGSGPQDRDETVFSHRPFLILADHLARNGIAVLRYDDRGVGGSTGNFAQATTEDLARDAEAAAAYLRSRSEIATSRIGLLGHSEGGIIAPMIAARNRDISFIVMLAGPSITGREIILVQDSLISAANGMSAEALARSRRTNVRIFDIIQSEADTAVMRSLLRPVLTSVAAERLDTAASEEVDQAGIERNISQLTSPWFRFFLTYDPYPALTQVRCPVLALNGEKDLQVPSRVNLAGISRALAAAKNTQTVVQELPGLNHLFQTSTTGSPAEYASIEETFSPAALTMISSWVRSVTINDGQ